MPALALLHFHLLPDGTPLAVQGENVLQYIDTSPPSFVPQPGGRRGVVGVAALSWSGVDHSPVALIDTLFALDLGPRSPSVGPLLLVRGPDTTVAGLLTSELARPPRYEELGEQPSFLEWEAHPKVGNLLRRCPVPDPLTGRPTWILDIALFFARMSQLE